MNWVHANGGIINGGVACVCTKWRVFVHFCAFLRFCVCVSARISLPQWAAEKHKFAQNSAKLCKKRFYAIPPLVIPLFARHRMKLQQPRNFEFGMFQFNLLGSQGGNSREMTTSPPGHHWEATVALITTAAKLQQFRANSREMTSQKLNNRCHRSMKFCVVSWLLSFQVPLGILWVMIKSQMADIARFRCTQLRTEHLWWRMEFLAWPNAVAQIRNVQIHNLGWRKFKGQHD